MKKSVLLISHGSHSPKTKEEVQSLVNSLKDASNIEIFEFAFLEIESPSIPEGIKLCVERGAEEVVVLLNFLNSGRHVDEDIPAIVDAAKKSYPDVSFEITQPVGQHAAITKLFLDMIS